MLRKILIMSAILAMNSVVAFASPAPYVGFSVSEKTNTATATNARGVPATLFIGYGGSITQNIYLGGELFGTIGSANIIDNGLESSYGYGISFIPGFMINDRTMGYIRLGVVRTRFTPSAAGNNTVSGGQFGLGMQTNIMQSWDLRGEYIYHFYSSLTGVNGSPKSDEFALGLVYKFD